MDDSVSESVDIAQISNSLPPLLAASFALVAIALSIILTFRTGTTAAIKLLGSLMVLALAFGANSVWTYGIGIFVVATLVTELEFLEKLAALFTNRKEYWEYLIRKASSSEIQQKVAEEARKESQATSSMIDKSAAPRTNSILAKFSEFEQRVVTAIRDSKPPFTEIDDIQQNLVIESRTKNARGIIDVVVAARAFRYVIEVKANRRIERRTALLLHELVQVYEEFLRERGSSVITIPVLIIDAKSEVAFQDDRIAILRFDTDTGSFIGLDDFWPVVHRIFATE